jgi:serine/threonine protein kinase
MTDFAAGGSLADGRYTLERRLGAGGMAAVWLARDERLGRHVAIKALSDTLAGEEGYVRRFRREARVAAGLSHPNLVRVFDFGDDPRPYLVMEYVEGGTLAEHLRDERELDCNGLVRRLLDALVHVHEAHIVHRDVKPANVLMGTDRRARLTDFGIAQPEDATQLTQTGGVMGTMRYLAPEVLEGEPATPGSDLYALGMLIRARRPADRARPRRAPLVRRGGAGYAGGVGPD